MSEARVAQLVSAYAEVARSRMAGVPVLHPGLRVQAVGFAELPDAPGLLCGVLITPWFMNLVRLPLQAAPGGSWPVGAVAARRVGTHTLDFIGSYEPGPGAFEAASLFSPMFDFADQAAAVATAQAVLRLLREAPAASGAPTAPSRRGFLLGRAAARPER